MILLIEVLLLVALICYLKPPVIEAFISFRHHIHQISFGPFGRDQTYFNFQIRSISRFIVVRPPRALQQSYRGRQVPLARPKRYQTPNYTSPEDFREEVDIEEDIVPENPPSTSQPLTLPPVNIGTYIDSLLANLPTWLRANRPNQEAQQPEIVVPPRHLNTPHPDQGILFIAPRSRTPRPYQYQPNPDEAPNTSDTINPSYIQQRPPSPIQQDPIEEDTPDIWVWNGTKLVFELYDLGAEHISEAEPLQSVSPLFVDSHPDYRIQLCRKYCLECEEKNTQEHNLVGSACKFLWDNQGKLVSYPAYIYYKQLVSHIRRVRVRIEEGLRNWKIAPKHYWTDLPTIGEDRICPSPPFHPSKFPWGVSFQSIGDWAHHINRTETPVLADTFINSGRNSPQTSGPHHWESTNYITNNTPTEQELRAQWVTWK